MPSPTYFAAAPAQELGQHLVRRVEEYDKGNSVTRHHDRLSRAYEYYYGHRPDGTHATSAISRGGEQGELAEIRINHSRSLVNTLLNLIIAPKLVWTPRATNIDYASVRQTELAASVLEYYWRDRHVAQHAATAVEEAIFLTEGFVHLGWDGGLGEPISPDPDSDQIVRGGDIRYTNVRTWDVIRDPNKASYHELDWVIVRLWRNRYDLAATHPKFAEKILAARSELPEATSARASAPETQTDDDIPVYHFYHKTSPAVPFGREALMLADGTVVRSGQLTLGQIPLHRVAASDLIGTPFGYSAYLEILGLQELSDSLHSSAATNLTTFATQSIAVEEGSNTQVDELSGGMRAIYYSKGGKPPAPLQLARSPAELYPYLQDIKKNQELLMGLNAVVRGEAQSDKLSGAALALLQSQALQQSSQLQGNYIRMVEELGTSTLKMVQKNLTTTRKVAIVGKHRMSLVQETEYDGKSFENVNQVLVDVGNPLSQTPTGRVQMAEQLLQMNLVKTAEQFQQVLDTGRLEPLTRGASEELVNILRENEDISQGITPLAMLQDNALLHCQEHRTPVASPSARRDPKVMQAYTDHMREHYSLYYGVPLEAVEADPMYRERMMLLMGLQPPPPMMPPGMMPPPGMEGGPPPGPDGGPPPGPGGPPPGLPGNPEAGAQPNLPSMPTNPATGAEWNPADGGGAVPR